MVSKRIFIMNWNVLSLGFLAMASLYVYSWRAYFGVQHVLFLKMFIFKCPQAESLDYSLGRLLQ